MAYTNIKKSSDYFNTKLYTGNNSSQSITGVGFQPDLLWIKSRGGIGNHFLSDVIRGSTKRLKSNATDAEDTITSLSSFDSDGFTLSNTGYNGSGETFATWNWKANGTGVANTDGSISSTVSANTTSGFSIVSYTGTGSSATIGHGLSSAPRMVIVKERSGVDAWIVGHSSIGFTKNLLLNATNAEYADSTIWNNTSPTSSVFSVGSSASTNQSSATYIAYCFAEKQGYSKFGSYTGNGNADGTFVYTGFKPAFLMVKNISTTDDWRMFDNRRPGINVIDDELKANLSNAEGTGDKMDFLSNGVKFRVNSSVNASGTFIYMAFAEEPLVGDNPATAR
jgi:hypothetical protein